MVYIFGMMVENVLVIGKSEKNGQHKDCDVCLLNDIKEEKKKKFEENIKYLNELFGSL